MPNRGPLIFLAAGLAALLPTFITKFVTACVLAALLAVAGFTLIRELTAAYNALSQRSLEEGGWPALVAVTADRLVDALASRAARVQTYITYRFHLRPAYVGIVAMGAVPPESGVAGVFRERVRLVSYFKK